MMKKYYEVVIEGSFDFIKGFVLGFFEGRGIQGDAIFAREHHIENERKFGQLLRLIGVIGDHASLIVGSVLHDMILEAIGKRKLQNDLKIVSVREITEAYFRRVFI
jgi:hypothetical protein